MNRKKSLYKPRKLTYEEHKKIDDFFRNFYAYGHEIFDLLRQSFGDQGVAVKKMANAINSINGIHQLCETQSCHDRPSPLLYGTDEQINWDSLYYHLHLWTTTGWR